RWAAAQVTFMLGYSSLTTGLANMWFGYNVLEVSRRVGRGQLDHTLVQPQPMWLALLTDGFSPIIALPMVVPGLCLLGWAAVAVPLPVSLGWLALLAANILGSIAVLLSFSYAIGSLAFWAPRGAEEISMSAANILYQLNAYPLDGAPAVLAGGLLSAV